MPAPLIYAAALGLQKMQEKKAKEEARRQATADLYTRQARRFGRNTEDLDAIGTARQIDEIEGPGYLGMVMGAEDAAAARGVGTEQPHPADVDPDDEEAAKKKKSGPGFADYFGAFTGR